MTSAVLGSLSCHFEVTGPETGPTLVLANSLGTDTRLWEPLLPRLPASWRVIRYDKRGHGLTDAPDPPYGMGTLVSDAARVLDHLGVKNCVFLGLSIGGMIAQGLAVKRPDLVRAVILSNTAAKIGTPEMWQSRIDQVLSHGIGSISEAVLERWFTSQFRASPDIAPWRNMLERQTPEGYAGCAAAIAGTDFYTPTSGLRIPAIGIAGSDDGATPPDLVRETTELIPGAELHLIRRAGHLPHVEQPAAYAEILNAFLTKIGTG